MKWAYILALIIVLGSVKADVDLSTASDQNVSGSTKIISTVGSVTTIIGDENNNTFSPTIKLSRRYFEDANLTISWNTNTPSLGNTNVLIEDKVVKYKRNTYELWFYQLPYGSDPSKGGFEFMAIMNSKPQTNTINFKIDSNNLDFFYQGPLKAEGEFINYTCNATACMDKGKVMAERPEKVVGSYAIFHKTKRDNQYTTGKVGHIYRPYVVDSLGAFTWADITITGNAMVITIPQAFLDNAVYPIYIDPSIGYATVGASGANWAGDSVRGNYVYTPATDGNLTTMNVYHYVGTAGQWRGVLFINSSNAVRAYTSAKQQAPSEVWDITDFNNGTTTIFAGTNYILGVWLGTSPNICGLRYDEGGTSYARGTQTFSNVVPPTDPQAWGSGKPVGGTQYHFSMYANYTEITSSDFTPAFNITITAPANGSSYTYPYNFTYNFTAIGNASTYDIKYRLDSNANVTYGNVANNTNIFASLGNLSAGIHSLVVYATNGTVTNTSNNITFTINRTSMQIFQLLNGSFQNITTTYGTATNASGYKAFSEGTLLLYRNDTSYSIPNILSLGVGTYNYTLYYAQTENYTANSTSLFVTVNRANMLIYQLLNGAWQNLTITYPTSSNASGYKNIAEGTLTLYRNGTSYSIPDIVTLGVGAWNYTLYFAQTDNYTTNSTSLFVNVNQNTTWGLSITVTPATTVTFGTATNTTGIGCPTGLTCTLYRNGTTVSNSDIQTLGVGSYNYTYYFAGNENYSTKTAQQSINVNQYTQWCNATIDGVWQNKTITYGTSATMNGSSSNVTGLLYRNGTSVSYPQTITSGGGVWNYTFYSAGNANYTSCTESVFLTVNKATPSLSITLAPSDTVTYPTTTTATGVGCTAPLTCTLYRGITTVSSPDVNIYDVGTYNYIYNTTGNENYSSASGSNLLTVNQNTTWWLNITVTPSATVTFGTQTTTTGIRCPAELTCTLYRNDTSYSNPNIATLGVGNYNYTYYTPGNGNYWPSTSQQTVTVNKASQSCIMYIDGADSDKTVAFPTSTNATGYATAVAGTLTRNGTGVANPEIGLIPIGDWNYTYYSAGNANYTACTDTNYLHVSSGDTTPPFINITSPLNQTYSQCEYQITLAATANETVIAWWYQLNNNGVNNSFTPPIAITVLNGSNYVQVWAKDSLGNIGYNETYFTLNQSCPIIGNATGGANYYFIIQNTNSIDDFWKYLILVSLLLSGGVLLRTKEGHPQSP